MKVCGNHSEGTCNLAREFTKRYAWTLLETGIHQKREKAWSVGSMVPLKTGGWYPLAEAQPTLGQEDKLWSEGSQDELVGIRTFKNKRKLNVT